MKYIRYLMNITAALWCRLRFLKLRKSFSIPSHLTILERVQLFKLAHNKKRACEIGSYIGASATAIGAAICSSGDTKLFCIDTWNNDAMSEGKKDTFEEFNNNVNVVANCIVPIRGWSTDVVGQISSHTDSLDFLFIDGDHSYEGVKADWEAYKKFLRRGSTVVFHDFGWADGVKRVIEEDVVGLAEDISSLPNMWWCTMRDMP